MAIEISKLLRGSLEVVSTVALTAASVALLWNLARTPDGPPPPPPPVERVDGLRIDGIKVRNRAGTSNVAIVEFSDYQCPYCAKYAKETYPAIRQKLVASGHASYVSFALPLEGIHPRARSASEAAECAARQDRFWQMHERLFASADALAPDDLVAKAESIGLDLSQFKECLAGGASAEISADIAEAKRLKVSSTPTFFVGLIEEDGSIRLERRINGAVPFEHFEAALADVSGTKLSLLEP